MFYSILVLKQVPFTTAVFLSSASDARTVRRGTLLSRIMTNDSMWGDDDIPKRKKTKREKYKHRRLNLPEHFEMCDETDTLSCRYHMTHASFSALVSILGQDISIDPVKSKSSTAGNDPITREMVVGIGLRYMGGEAPKSLADIFGISIPSANQVINVFLEAVDKSDHEHLSIDLLPKSDLEKRRMVSEWQKKATRSAFLWNVRCH